MKKKPMSSPRRMFFFRSYKYVAPLMQTAGSFGLFVIFFSYGHCSSVPAVVVAGRDVTISKPEESVTRVVENTQATPLPCPVLQCKDLFDDAARRAEKTSFAFRDGHVDSHERHAQPTAQATGADPWSRDL